jgi:hypothetical protein
VVGASAARRAGEFLRADEALQTFAKGLTPKGTVEGAVEPVTSFSQTAVKFGAPSAALGVAAFPASDAFEARFQEGTREEQRQMLEQIRNDSTLTPDQKQDLIAKLSEGGAFSDPTANQGDDSLLGNLLPDKLFSTETLLVVVALMVLWRLSGNIQLGSGASN